MKSATQILFRSFASFAFLVALLFLSSHADAQSQQEQMRAMKLMKLFQQQVQGEKFAGAADTLKELLPIAEQMFGRNSPDLIRMEINRGTILRNLGRHKEAKVQLETAVQHAKTRLGMRHGITGVALNAQGAVYRLQGDVTQAHELYKQSIRVLEASGDKFIGDRIDAYANYGDLMEEIGLLSEGLRFTQSAYNLSLRKFGEKNPRTATLLNNLGMRQRSLGNMPEAEKTMRRTVAVYKQLYHAKHQEVGSSLQNLALVLTERAKNPAMYKEAIASYEEAYEILRDKLGETHPVTLTTRGNLGQVYVDMGEATEALPVVTDVFSQQKKVLGEEHRTTVTTQWHLGLVKLDLGEFDAARELFESSLRSIRGSDSSRIAEAATVATYLGLIDGVQGNVGNAIKRFGSAAQTANDAAWRELPALKPVEQGRFMIVNYNPAIFSALSLGFQFPENAQVVNATAEWSANAKGIATEALAVARKAKRDRLNRKGAIVSSSEKLRWVTLDEIRETITDDGVWIDITRQDFIDFKGKSNQQRLQDPQYVAWIVPKKGEISRIELGDAAEIDKLVDALRKVINGAAGVGGKLRNLGELEATEEAKKTLAAVGDRIWNPIQAKLPEKTKAIHLSPDGALWLVPWNALPIEGRDGADAKFLVQRYALTTFGSGRNFVPVKPTLPEERSASAVFSNPAFDQSKSEKRVAYTAVFREPPPPSPNALPSLRAFDPTQSRAAPLPGTELEARAILPNMKTWLDNTNDEPVRYSGPYALESVAKQVVSPRTLVFATHGFFTDDSRETFDPLRRCGLLLAGCNDKQSIAGDDNGVLTGVEIADLTLQGTELVVLSACETGIGRIENGNGVAGIRRAFHLAGARSVASTLWQVPDFDTAKLMGDFFAELANGKSKGEALRQAQIRRIESREKRNGAAHPFYWAGFSISGR